MPEAVITADRVSKRFRRHGGTSDSLRDALARCLRRRSGDPHAGTFEALHDVSFAVGPGEALGIIGPNGAGKSTMLKLLAGILRPDAGNIRIDGRIAALIELGAGFHGDLTGRENIFLNAAILGMPQREARRRFDRIVEFSGVGEFLDTPVRHYSSGMHARLGFAIASHVDSRALLVDEVLSVGDRTFRARCMSRMSDYLRGGGAVVFVSHDLDAVQRFCGRVLVIAGGRAVFCGGAGEAVAHYQMACVDPWRAGPGDASERVEIHDLRISDEIGAAGGFFSPGAAVDITFSARFREAMKAPSFGLSLTRAEDHLCVFETSASRIGALPAPAAPAGSSRCVRIGLTLNVLPGEYLLGLHVREWEGTHYAMNRTDMLRLIVSGPRQAGGIVHLSPDIAVESQSEEMTAASDGRKKMEGAAVARAPSISLVGSRITPRS